MDRDNSMYSRFGSFTPRTSFLDSIPPLPWMHTEMSAPANYPTVMEDPRMKAPTNTYPLYLEGPAVGTSDASRYYNEMPFQADTSFANTYDSTGQIPPERFPTKSPGIPYRGAHKGQPRQPAFINDLAKSIVDPTYDPTGQNMVVKSATNYKFPPHVKYPDPSKVESNVKTGPIFPKGPFVSGVAAVAAAAAQISGQNLDTHAENAIREVIEKGLESYNIDQAKGIMDGSRADNIGKKKMIKSWNADEAGDTLNLSRDNRNIPIDMPVPEENPSLDLSTKHLDESGESGHTDAENIQDHSNASTDTEVTEPLDEPIIEENEPQTTPTTTTATTTTTTCSTGTSTSNDKDVQADENEVRKVGTKRKNELDVKQILSILGNVKTPAPKAKTKKSDLETPKKGAVGAPPKRVVKIIRVIKDKNGKFIKQDPGKIKVLLKKKPGIANTIQKGKKSTEGRRPRKCKKGSGKNEDCVIIDDSKGDPDFVPKVSKPQVIYVQPSAPVSNTSSDAKKGAAEEVPKGHIYDNDACANSLIMSLTTLPVQLFLGVSGNSEQGIGVYCKSDIPKGTQMGPVIGEKILFQDLTPHMDFQHIWYFPKDEQWKDLEFINTCSETGSNWTRYLRASVEKDCNLLRVLRDRSIYLVSRRFIKAGEELIYYAKSFDDFKGYRKTSTGHDKQTEGGEDPNYCKLCNCSFSNEVNLLKHCQIYHTFSSGKTRSQCRICNEIFPSRRELKKHVRVHDRSAGGEFICPICGKAYVYQTQLKEHVKVLHYEEPTECEECGKICMNPRKLQVHKNRAHSGRTWQCDKCSKIFRQKTVLLRHKRIHEEVYTVACDRCGKLFRDKHNLKVHLLTHSGIKPFQCQMQGCTAAFTVKQCLQGHYRKVHGYNDYNMPEIRRSIPFSDDAYMGEDNNVEVLKF